MREPMLARAVDHLPVAGALPGQLVFEPKWDGYRTLLSVLDERVRLCSRTGTDLTGCFPEVARAATDLNEDVVVDGEVVVYTGGRLEFTALQHRLGRSSATVSRLARTEPAHLIAFDLLHRAGTCLVRRPYRERRRALEEFFADHHLVAPWSLCPASTDRRQAEEWMSHWSAVGVEGVVVKGADQQYEPGRRGWLKVRSRRSTEALAGAVTGPVRLPHTLLLGRHTPEGRLCLVARTTPLAAAQQADLGRLLTPGTAAHPWEGMRVTAHWGSRDLLRFTTVEPGLVVEFEGDTAVDHGRWRHPVRVRRLRPDLAPGDVPRFGAGYETTPG
ncbi:ATP-dependent DNA ligase [Wenjunlia vitaminophila]|nr:ATP-dependent DNA ligase [Wenjunlia vitaminophila]